MVSHSKIQRVERASTWDGFKVLAVAIRREPWIFTLSTIGSALFGALTVADAWVLGWSTDHVILPAYRTGHIGAGWLIAVVALFVAVAIGRAVGVVARRLGAGVMQYRMQAHYRRAVTRQYLKLPLAWHQAHPTGQLLSNANADVEAAWAPIAPLPMAVGTIAMMLIAVIQMFAADLVLALLGMIVFPAVVLTNLAYQRRASPLITRAQQLRAELSEVAHESFDGALVVKTLGREAEETERFAAKARELRDTNIRAGRIRAAFDPTLAALPDIGVLVVLAVGVVRVLHGHAQAGDVVQVGYLLTIVAFPIRSLGWLLGEFPRSVVGYRRVRHVLDATDALAYGERRLPSADGAGARLALEDVAFAYDPAQPLLTGVTFDVAPGRTTAIVGPTASGKSTLTTLMTRLVDADAGRITLDGVDLRDLAPGELAQAVAIVPQQAFLFDDTVRGNVTLSHDDQADFTDEDIWAALRAAQAEQFVKALPDGLDTRLGERGTSLSGGQRQRISLARALIRRPRVLILDDATSAVDPDVEQRILAALRGGLDTSSPSGSDYSTSVDGRAETADHSTSVDGRIETAGHSTSVDGRVATADHSTSVDGGIETAGHSTLVVVAYRKATIGLADEVIHLDDGRVAGRGTHQELLATSPAYADLVNAYETEGTAE